MNEKTDSKNVKSITKAFNILMLFDWNNRELSLTEVANRLDLAKSTASRLLNTLVDLGFLNRNPDTGRFVLGSKIYYLGQIARDTNDLSRVCLPVLESLTEQTKETSHVYIFSGMDRICLEQVESPQVIKQSVKVGSVEPIWQGASGKVILAFQSKYIQKLAADSRFGEEDSKEKDDFMEVLKKIRENGVAVRPGKSDPSGVGCVSAPIFDMYGKVQGALAISTPAMRFPEDSSEFEYLVRKKANEISVQLGYRQK